MSPRQRFWVEIAVITFFGLLAGWFAAPGKNWPVPSDTSSHSLDGTITCTGNDCIGPHD